VSEPFGQPSQYIKKKLGDENFWNFFGNKTVFRAAHILKCERTTLESGINVALQLLIF
jgi:hypothetical protein